MSATTHGRDSVERLQRTVRGELIRPGDPRYDEHRRVWNGMIDKHPGFIVRCTSRDDVVATVNFARAGDHLLAVRGGGHSFAGFSTCDGGVVIDLSLMNGVEVDAEHRRARAGGGATWGAFDAATHAHGLASTGGLISSTGIAGLTLGGGIGWLQRKLGLACDNLMSVELVTAAGEVVQASGGKNSELFWGLRGGGGNFGVVTSFEFQLHAISTVVGGLLLFPSGRAAEVMRFYRGFLRNCPDELTTWLSAITAPVADFVPTELRGKPALAVLACHCGDPTDAARAIAPLRNLGPASDRIESMPYPAIQTMFDADLPKGIRCYQKAGYITDLSDDVVETILTNAAAAPSPASTFDLHEMGGAPARVPDQSTAFGDRNSAFCFNIVGVWNDAEADDRNRQWVRAFATALEPFGTGGVYVNFTADPDRVRAAYSDEKYEKLRTLKRQYDPSNLFRLNQNLAP